MASVIQKQLFNVSNVDRFDALKFKRDIPIQQLPKTRDNTTVVCLESNQKSTFTENNIRLHTLIRSNRCSLILYSNVTKCIKYLKHARSHEYLIIIIMLYPIEIMQKMIYRLRQYRIVQTIFIISCEKNVSDYFSSTIDNIFIFQEQNSILNRLETLIDDIQKDNFEGGLFTAFNCKEKALKDVRQELAGFVWNHVFQILVRNMSCDSLEAKQQMLAECRAYYRNDRAQLAHIDEFQSTYESSDAIRWYTKPSFLFYLVNKALRSDVLALYTFRYFIKDLCNRLEEMSRVHSDTAFHLYRGAKIHRDEVENLQIGSFVAANSFFSCSRHRNVAEMFIGIDAATGRTFSHGREEKQQFVLFEIDVDIKKCPDVVVANISAQSLIPDENEMIFILGSTFIITYISYDDQKNLWFIQMSSFSDWAEIDQEYDQYIHVRLQLTNPTILFGHALALIKSEYLQSLHYFYWLLRTLPINHTDRAVIYYGLGFIYRSLEKYEKALACYRCAQLLLRRLLPQTMFDYCRVLRGIGVVYLKSDDSERAIKQLEHAFMLQRKFLPDDHTEIPFHRNRLGYAYLKAERFEHALFELSKADEFFEHRMPIDHQGHAQTLHVLALMYRALGDEDKAYSYFKEALRKRDALLARDHPDVASTCFHLSLIHEDRGEYEIALEYAKRSLNIRSIKLPYYHSKLKSSCQLVERLKQHQNIFHTT